MSANNTAQADERERRRRERRVRTLVVGAVGLAIPIADIAFNLGAYGAVFYGRMIALWAVATTTAICLLALGREQQRVGWIGFG